jgi:hypothetical protein
MIYGVYDIIFLLENTPEARGPQKIFNNFLTQQCYIPDIFVGLANNSDTLASFYTQDE